MNPTNPTPSLSPAPLSKPRTALLYLATITLGLLLLTLVLQLWHADFSIPWSYESRDLLTPGQTPDPAGSNDALFVASLIKSIHDNGYVYQNNFLGMPTPQDLRDYPLPETLFYLTQKFLFLFTSNYALVLNLFYLLTFPLTILTALFAMRQFHLPPLPAAVGSLLYAFLPYHFLRGEQHLSLAAYFLVPLAITVIWWLLSGQPLFTPPPGSPKKFSIRPKGLLALLFFILLGSAGVYYSAFTLFLLLLAGLITSLHQKKLQPLLTAAALSALLIITLLLNLTPTLIYHHQNGPNPAAAIRPPGQTELFSLKITQLLLPIPQHRLPLFANLTNTYDTQAPLVTENKTTSLGLIGSLGFLTLLAPLLTLRPRGPHRQALLALSLLTLASLLLATTGGFGSLLSFTLSPLIRSYCRIVVFIAFFSLLAALLLFDHLRQKSPWMQKSPTTILLLTLILALGIYDQTSPAIIPLYAQSAASFQNDADFIHAIEAAVPPNAMIFQLPYIPFPEYSPTLDYQLFRGYLHSNSLRWSYAAVKGRDTATWQQQLLATQQNTPALISLLQQAGFRGIYIDRIYGNFTPLENALQQATHTPPLISHNARLIFFPLTPPPTP